MALDAPGIAWLRTAEGQQTAQEAQEALQNGSPVLRLIEQLRRSRGAEEARWAVGLAEGRLAARAKLREADRLYLDRDAAEQATSTFVAARTAARLAGASRIADLGCGAGADAIALAAHAAVVAVDLDPGRVAMTAANAELLGLPIEAVVADLLELTPGAGVLAGVDAVWLDPARRDSSGRVLDPRRWSPPLADALALARRFPRAGIKVAPGIDLAEVPGDAEVEFITLDGSLVEAVIWLGEAVTAPRRATALPADASIEGEPDAGGTRVAPPGAYLYDLNPAVGRASLVDVLAPAIDGWLLAPDVAYLSADHAVDTPFARRFRVLRWLPYSERQLLAACREAGASRVEVMRRASPVETNALEVRLNEALRGAQPSAETRVLTVALTRVGTEHVAILCERERSDRDDRGGAP